MPSCEDLGRASPASLRHWASYYEHVRQTGANLSPLMRDAADRLEDKSANVAELEASLRECSARLDANANRIESLMRSIIALETERDNLARRLGDLPPLTDAGRA